MLRLPLSKGVLIRADQTYGRSVIVGKDRETVATGATNRGLNGPFTPPVD